MINKLKQLAKTLEGDLFFDKMIKTLYATDASSYREFPLAVAIPKTQQDIAKLIQFASTHQTSLIPRTAGTSLAGQVVGSGIVVDVSGSVITIGSVYGTRCFNITYNVVAVNVFGHGRRKG